MKIFWKLTLPMLLFFGCVTREKIEATIWLTNAPLPLEYCEQIPELKMYGFYRKLNNNKIEFVSFCKKESRDFVTMPRSEFDEILDQALPKPREIEN